MNKTILAAASYYKRSYFFNEGEFGALPEGVRNEIRIMLTMAAEQAKGVITLGFYESGDFFCEAVGEDNDADYDEINARLVVDRMLKEKESSINQLRLWRKLYFTDEGRAVRDSIIKAQNSGEE